MSLLITDHLEWESEYEHLVILQDKINSYLAFIESKQYESTYPKDNFESFVIEIHFQHGMTDNCLKFLETVASQAEELNVVIKVEME